jgi:CRISPR-associated endoribonuclease Cas6
LIIQSLHSRFSAFSQEFSLGDQEIMQQLAGHMRIIRYSLHSANFHLKGARITGYKGRINLNIFGPDQVARLIGMLLAFSEYSGVGIKTSLGMGGCRIEQTPINKEIKRMGGENE